jgi:TPR repeat protein
MTQREPAFATEAEERDSLERLFEHAEAGSGDHMCRIGDLYRRGGQGLSRSARRAFVWYARSALAGDSYGQNNLGACYEHGYGCERSVRHAVKWYRAATLQGHPTAAMNLGYCCLDGRGVDPDKDKALKLFAYALRGGEERARPETVRLAAPDAGTQD